MSAARPNNKRKNQSDAPAAAAKNQPAVKKSKTNQGSAVPQTLNPQLFSSTSFDSLPISDSIKKAIAALNISTMTRIQEQTIQPLLKGNDLLGKAKTGSGKTLAFLVPALQLLIDHKFTPEQGLGALIIIPTRELALQIKETAEKLVKDMSITVGIAIGGTSKNAEASRISKGVNILVATPGRLIDHLMETKPFVIENLKVLIIDEADRILDIGFERDLTRIIKQIPKKRQTVLFSATQETKVQDLVRLAFSTTSPLFVDVDHDDDSKTVKGLEQSYYMVKSSEKVAVLSSALKKNKDKKIIVFFATCKSVKFFHEFFCKQLELPVLALHGKLNQSKRSSTFFEFRDAPTGILFCTDVAARGVDIPAVDYIFQFDPPQDIKEYVHRVGRTARAGKTGTAFLFLLHTEAKFLDELKKLGIPVMAEQLVKAENKDKLVAEKLKVAEQAKAFKVASLAACKAYLRFYKSYALKKVFNVKDLDPLEMCLQFGVSPDRVPTITSVINKKPGGKQGGKGRRGGRKN